MNVLVFNGSPRKEKGATASLLQPFVNGMKSAGAQVELLLIHDLKINPCLGCFSCWIKTPGKCVQDDDMQGVYPKIADADILVLATPVYVDGMTGPMKILLDRLIPLVEGSFEIREGHCRHPVREWVKRGKLVLVSTCGFTEMDNFEPLVNHVKAVCLNMGREFAGSLLRPYGWFLKELNRRGHPVEKVTTACRDAGTQIIREGKISLELQNEVSQDFGTKEQVLEYHNPFYN